MDEFTLIPYAMAGYFILMILASLFNAVRVIVGGAIGRPSRQAWFKDSWKPWVELYALVGMAGVLEAGCLAGDLLSRLTTN